MPPGKIVLENQFGEVSENVILPIQDGPDADVKPEFQFASGAGMYSGEGAPAFEANPGSMYLRIDGANNNQVMYVTYDGTTWAALTGA